MLIRFITFSKGFAVNGKPDLSFNSIGTVNNISFMFPEVPLLSQPAEIDESTFCNITHQESAKCYESQDCFCQHRLMAPERSIVEFVLMNTGARKDFNRIESTQCS